MRSHTHSLLSADTANTLKTIIEYSERLKTKYAYYFDSIPSGLILWFKSDGKKIRTATAFGLTGKAAWVTSHITSGQFRYAPIELMAGKDYEHVKAQLG